MQEKKKAPALFKFQQLSPAQRKIFTWWQDSSPVKSATGIIADGAIRSGKTVSMSLSFCMWAMATFNGQNFGMCGKTVGSFRRNVLTTLRLTLASRGYEVDEHRADNMFFVRRNGVENSFYIFGGRDERSQDLVQGVTLAGVFFDEVALMPESFVNQATGRCSVEGSKYWFNCNPEGPLHWFKTGWIDKAVEKNLLYLHFTMDDNYSLSDDIKARYRSMYTGVFFKRYILGLWTIAEGLVYDMFDADRHVKNIDFKPSNHCWYYVAIDYGTVNPFAAILIEYNRVTHKSVAVDECYYNGREKRRVDNEAYYKMICDMVGDLSIKEIIIDPSAAAMIETIKKHGKYRCQAANNDVLNGIQEVTKYLNLGILEISSKCKNTITEFVMYSWDEKADKDAVIKEYDHAMDAIRYYIYTEAVMLNRGKF